MSGHEVLEDRYELGLRIGQGGAADVYQATDLVLRRRVAVKVLRGPSGEHEAAARFRAEARTLARLNHPGLVTLLDAGAVARRPFLVMELVEGPPLSALVAARALTPARVVSIGGQLAGALAYAHSRGVVHRDVKPGNVLTTADGRAKLADFGIARILGDPSHQTLSGQVVGTAAYLAPEQVRGDPLTAAVDVYALGLLLIEMTTGKRVYQGTGPEAAVARLQQAPVIPTELSEPRRALLAAMTSIDPRQRPSAGTVALALTDDPPRRPPGPRASSAVR